MKKIIGILVLLCGFVLDMGPPIHAADAERDKLAARPAVSAPFVDPLGGVVTRQTDPSMSPNDGTNKTLGLIHEYSRFPVLSADNKNVALQVLGGKYRGGYEIRDLATHALKFRLDTDVDPEISWHPLDKNRLFYRYANEIRVFHTDTGKTERLMQFPQYTRVSTREEGRPSDDWRFYAFIGEKSDGNNDLVVVDLTAKKILGVMPQDGDLDWISMSPSGQYVVVMWTDGQGTQLYTREFVPIRQVLSDYVHADFAFDATGHEVLVYQAASGGQIEELGCPNPPNGAPIASAQLSNGQKKILLGDCNKTDWSPVLVGQFIGWNWFTPHFSGIASRAKPGWILVSTYTEPDNKQWPFSREVFWLALDGSGKVRHLAQHHSDVAYNSAGEKDYFAEPHATSSWDGSIVLVASVWGTPWKQYDLYTVTAVAPPKPPPCP